MALARRRLGGAGTQSAGLSFGGDNGGNKDETEEYNGTSWSAGGALATARYYLVGCGTQAAGLSIGGYVSSHSTVTEEYDIAVAATTTVFGPNRLLKNILVR